MARRSRSCTLLMFGLLGAACADTRSPRPADSGSESGAIAASGSAADPDAPVAGGPAGDGADAGPEGAEGDGALPGAGPSGDADAGPGVGGLRDAAVGDASPDVDAAVQRQDAGRPQEPVDADAAVFECSEDTLPGCVPAVPDHGDIGDLSVSDVPRPECPEELPSVGATCTIARLKCGYGSRARSDCRRVFQCVDGLWVDDSPWCFLTPEGVCPQQQPAEGLDCDMVYFPVNGILAVCEYGETSTCTCGRRYFRDGEGGWNCNESPPTPGCPAVVPNFGEGCDVQGTECSYGPICQPGGGRWFCRNGQWEYAGVESVCQGD